MAPYTSAFSFAGHSLDDTLIDLGVRFVINCPPEDISTAVRLFFQLEEAQWFYEDFAREQNQSLPSLKMRPFVTQLYKAMPLMNTVCADPAAALAEFQEYKSSIPVRGGILLNEKLDKVLMVRSWKGSSWGFPRGKINKEEDDAVCAVREVLEETGYNMSSLVDRNEYIESTYGGKNIRLYVVSGVPEQTHFETQTRKEISRIEWIPVRNLPVFNRKPRGNLNYYMVTPFMNDLRSYISRKKGYATKLSESETMALKSMLGISKESPEPVRNDEATAQHLLAMLRGSATSHGTTTDNTLLSPAESSQVATPAEQPVSGAGILADSGHKQDREILLNLLKQGTPEPAEREPGADQNKAEVEGTKEILALLQHEMATEKTVSQPPTIQPLESQVDLSTRPAQAPALPPMGLLESLVQSRRSNPVRKQNVPNPNEHRSTAPSKNSLLSLLNKPKQAESAKLMALLKPVKPPQPAPKPRRSALMSLLESAEPRDLEASNLEASNDAPPPPPSAPSAAFHADAVPQPPVPPSADDTSHGLHPENESVTVAASEKTKNSPQRPQSSLLGLLNPGAPAKSSQINPTEAPATENLTVSTATLGTASPDRALSRSADPQPISTMSSARGPAADAESMQQAVKRSEVANPGKPRETPSKAAGDALLGLLHPSADQKSSTQPSATNGKVAKKNANGHLTDVKNKSETLPLQMANTGLTGLEPPPHDSSESAHNMGHQRNVDDAPDLPQARSLDTKARKEKRAQNADSPGENDRQAKKSSTKVTNPLLKLLEPPVASPPQSEKASSEATSPSSGGAPPKSNRESQALMSLLTGGASSASARPRGESRGDNALSSHPLHRGGPHDAGPSAEAPVTKDENNNAEKRSPAKPQSGSHIHLLKLLG